MSGAEKSLVAPISKTFSLSYAAVRSRNINFRKQLFSPRIETGFCFEEIFCISLDLVLRTSGFEFVFNAAIRVHR